MYPYVLRCSCIPALVSTFLVTSCATADGIGAVVETADVDRFYRLYDAAGGSPSAQTLQREYIDVGTDGLKAFARLRRVNGATIAENVSRNPDAYERARLCADSLPNVTERLSDALRKLSNVYPDARNPAVTIVVGRGKPVGIGYPDTGVQIGLEAMCDAEFLNPNVEDRFVYVGAHEYIHVQQSPELIARVNSDSATVLDVSLSEGIAEFVGEFISGGVAYGSHRGTVDGRELEIETAFAAEMGSTDLSNWVYNSSPDNPGDLGYWVGYRIAKAYYYQAEDKNGAVRAMLELTHPEAFVQESGWYPGIELD